MTAEPDLLPSSIAAFTEALHGERGSLDAWLEVNDEREVRAHVEAYASARVARATAELEAEMQALAATADAGFRDGWNRAAAAKDAEIEALRAQLDEQCRLHAIGMERELALIAERDRLRVELRCLREQYDERTACMIVHRGSALACSDAVRSAYSDEHHRAKRLAEALRAAWLDLEQGIDQRIVIAAIRAVLHPTAAQENDDA